MSRRRLLAGVAVVGLLGGLAFAGWQWLNRPPSQYQRLIKETNFSFYYPSDEEAEWVIDEDSMSFDRENQVLILNFHRGTTKLVLTQQAEPGSFVDIPTLYPKLLDKLHQYAEFQTAIGRVTLTRPEELKGKQSAVANLRGTLIFGNPDADLSETDWKAFFGSLESVR